MSLNYNIFRLLSNMGLESKAVQQNVSIIQISEDMASDILYSEEHTNTHLSEVTDHIANASANYHIKNVSNFLLLFVAWLGMNATIVSLSNLLAISGLATLNIVLSIGLIAAIANILFLILIYQTVRLIVAGYFLGKLGATTRLIIERMHSELGEEVTSVILDPIIEWEDD